MAYGAHLDLTTPPNAVVLWRYLDFAKFIELLESRALWFARVDQLEDPLEGTHTDAELAGIRKHLEKDKAEEIIGIFRNARSEVYVNSWRSGKAESLAMWDLFGKGSGIVAIKSTVGRLKRATLKFKDPIYISKTKYIDWGDSPGLDNVLVACSRKDICHQHESEVRAMIMGDFGLPGPNRVMGILIPVDVKALISEVVVGPREHEWILRLVRKVMLRYGLRARVIASNRLKPRA